MSEERRLERVWLWLKTRGGEIIMEVGRCLVFVGLDSLDVDGFTMSKLTAIGEMGFTRSTGFTNRRETMENPDEKKLEYPGVLTLKFIVLDRVRMRHRSGRRRDSLRDQHRFP